jgi:hypothetical protein
MGEIAPSGPLRGRTTINKIKGNNPDDGYNNFARVTNTCNQKWDVFIAFLPPWKLEKIQV